MKGARILQIILIVFATTGSADIISRFTVDSGTYDRMETPVSVSLDGLDYNQDNGTLSLVEIVDDQRLPVACQVEEGGNARLWWILTGDTPANTIRTFELVQSADNSPEPMVTYRRETDHLTLLNGDQPVLQYRLTDIDPPQGVSPLYKRSAYIHPLWSPSGTILTRIQPPDHYHHYGMWNPWTKTQFQGRHIDFWNLGSGEGTVRFAGMNAVVQGPVFGGFSARQEHVDFQARGPDQVALNEVWDVRVWNVDLPDQPCWLWDLTTTLNCATDSSLLLEAYRYGGGLGFRATEDWTRENSTVLTSEGMDRSKADGSRARWCIVTGANASGKESGILFMSYPANRMHPEPMRVWPPDANNGRGDMFFEFCPIRHEPWLLQPGQTYTLKYRMLVFDGTLSADRAEQLWRDFAVPPQIKHIDIEQ